MAGRGRGGRTRLGDERALGAGRADGRARAGPAGAAAGGRGRPGARCAGGRRRHRRPPRSRPPPWPRRASAGARPPGPGSRQRARPGRAARPGRPVHRPRAARSAAGWCRGRATAGAGPARPGSGTRVSPASSRSAGISPACCAPQRRAVADVPGDALAPQRARHPVPARDGQRQVRARRLGAQRPHHHPGGGELLLHPGDPHRDVPGRQAERGDELAAVRARPRPPATTARAAHGRRGRASGWPAPSPRAGWTGRAAGWSAPTKSASGSATSSLRSATGTACRAR